MFSLKLKRLEYLATNRGDLITEEFLVSFINKNRDLITEDNIDRLIEILELDDPTFKDIIFGGKNTGDKKFDSFWLEKLRSFKL